MQLPLRSHQLLGRDLQRLGSSDEVGFVRGQEIENGAVGFNLANRFAQAVRRQPGKIEQAVRTVLVRQHPAQRGQRESRSVLNRIFIGINNCQQSIHRLCTGVFKGRRRSGAQ